MGAEDEVTGTGAAAESVSQVIEAGISARGRAGGSRLAAVPHPSKDERRARGRAARASVPRRSFAAWTPAADRSDPIDLLTAQEASRVQDLVPVRHARMAVSPFTFYRGSAVVMASDLAGLPRSGLDVQLCGDAHLSNFGMFGAPDRSVVFDVNDFDETHPGPFEWDVMRLAASFILAGRDNGLPEAVGRASAAEAASSYRAAMAAFAQMTELGIWYDRINVDRLEDAVRLLRSTKDESGRTVSRKTASRTVQRALAAARARDAWSAISKITEVVDGKRRFRHRPPVLTRLDVDADAFEVLNGLFREYRSTLQEDRQELLKRYQIIDMGHKVVGVGSVGLLAFVLLMRGADDDDLMVLQVKQAQASVLERFTGESVFSQHGHRVVAGQRLMQAAGDSFLGWIDGPNGRSFYVRQLRDMKYSPDPATLNEERLPRFAGLCGYTLARAHARSGDAVAISAYLGRSRAFDVAMADFSTAYADQVERDYRQFTAAIEDKRVTAHESETAVEGAAAAVTITRS